VSAWALCSRCREKERERRFPVRVRGGGEGAEEGANLGEGKAMGWRSTPESDGEESESPGRLGVGGGGYEPSGRCGRCVRAVGLPRLDSHVGTCCWTTTTARANFGF
jgi:hypothetical protein